jgi:[acyl-carrier-protein] S-malonyltransferase
MGWDLYRNFKEVGEIFSECGRVLDQDISRLCFEGPQEQLDMTENTQVAVLAVDVAVHKVFQREIGMKPIAMAGHSLGEYAALASAGAIGFADTLNLIKARGRYHQEAVSLGEGCMAAIIGLDKESVDGICREIVDDGGTVEIANINGSHQFVVSGYTGDVHKSVVKAKEAKAKLAVTLPISVPCHCSLLRNAAKKLAADLDNVEIKDCEIPVIPNLDPRKYHSKETTVEFLTRQLVSPVKWEETIKTMVDRGIDTIVELGPKKVLSGLIKRIDKNIRTLNIEDMVSLEKAVKLLSKI